MGKKALIEVRLVPESKTINNGTIEKEIKKEAQIPWAKEIVKVTVSGCS